jgi:SAM-dependent methyltransferase
MAGRPKQPAFELAPELYAQLIHWPRRLQREGPFFRSRFEAAGVATVLDLACGTGHHAALFASWGLDVTAADGSPEMIAYCRSTHGESGHLRWEVRMLQDPLAAERTFDAVVCIGNSLALLPDVVTAQAVAVRMIRMLNPGGVCIVQLLNLWRLPDGPIEWQKLKRVGGGAAERVVLKGVHRVGRRGFVDVVVHDVRGTEPQMEAQCTSLVGLECEDLVEAFAAAGCDRVQTFGDYGQAAFERGSSPDLIIAAHKGGML